jgi:hypothetical protein
MPASGPASSTAVALGWRASALARASARVAMPASGPASSTAVALRSCASVLVGIPTGRLGELQLEDDGEGRRPLAEPGERGARPRRGSADGPGGGRPAARRRGRGVGTPKHRYGLRAAAQSAASRARAAATLSGSAKRPASQPGATPTAAAIRSRTPRSAMSSRSSCRAAKMASRSRSTRLGSSAGPPAPSAKGGGEEGREGTPLRATAMVLVVEGLLPDAPTRGLGVAIELLEGEEPMLDGDSVRSEGGQPLLGPVRVRAVVVEVDGQVRGHLSILGLGRHPGQLFTSRCTPPSCGGSIECLRLGASSRSRAATGSSSGDRSTAESPEPQPWPDGSPVTPSCHVWTTPHPIPRRGGGGAGARVPRMDDPLPGAAVLARCSPGERRRPLRGLPSVPCRPPFAHPLSDRGVSCSGSSEAPREAPLSRPARPAASPEPERSWSGASPGERLAAMWVVRPIRSWPGAAVPLAW